MTVDEMPAGRATDTLVVEKIMEWTNVRTGVKWDASDFDDLYGKCPGGVDSKSPVPQYSKDLNEAWKLIDKLPGTGSVQKRPGGVYTCVLHTGTEEHHAGIIHQADADTPALAIVRAVLKRMGVK